MQGFNMGRYIPPDAGPLASFNSASGKGNPLKSRMRPGGGLVVRFECPFPIWCTTCTPEQIIGQGVRFNAEKKKVGMYYSTPIWEFGLRHTVCGGQIVVRTDPRAGEYVVVSGGRRRVESSVREGEEEIGFEVLGKGNEEEKERLERDGGFARVEKKVVDKKRFLDERDRLEELKGRSERDWSDPYEMNRRIRREFRVGRKSRKEAGVRTEELRNKLSLGIELVEESQEDAERAGLIEFQSGGVDSQLKPLFSDQGRSSERPDTAKRKGTSSADLVAEKKAKLQNKLTGNTKAVLDPFLNQSEAWQPKLRQKEINGQGNDIKVSVQDKALVSYESDSS